MSHLAELEQRRENNFTEMQIDKPTSGLPDIEAHKFVAIRKKTKSRQNTATELS